MRINNLFETNRYGWSFFYNDKKEICLLDTLNNKLYLTTYKKEPLINELKFVDRIIDIIEEQNCEERHKEESPEENIFFPEINNPEYEDYVDYFPQPNKELL